MAKGSMIALQYELSISRYLLARTLTKAFPHRFFRWAGCLHLRDIPVPGLPGPDWVLVKTTACGICGSDLNALRGAESFSMEPYASFPSVMGHEIVGRVVSLGASVRDIAEDSRVAVENVLPCVPRAIDPPCRACREGDYSLCENFVGGHLAPGVITGFTKGLGGGWGEYLVAHKSQLFPLPDTIPDGDAVLVDSLASAMQPVSDHIPTDGATVIVYGAGIIGLNVIQCLRAVGSRVRIVCIARHAFQAEWARKLGADVVIAGNLLQGLASPPPAAKPLEPPPHARGARCGDAHGCARGNLFKAIADLTGARIHKPTFGPPVLDGGVDQVFDCVGSSQTIDYSMRFVRKRGKVVLVGTAGTINKVDASPLWFKEVRLTGSAMFSHTTVGGSRKRTYQHVIDLLAAGKLKADGLVTHRFPITDYARALKVALDKKRHQGIKVAFEFG